MKKRFLTVCLTLGLILGVHRGYVALWDDGAKEPRRIFPYQAASLPPADQAALERGIRVRSRQELNRLIEDFFS